MGLIGVFGKKKEIDKALCVYACNNTPALIIDCANVTDPHTLVKHTEPDNLRDVHALHTDLLYVYRDMLFEIPFYVATYNIKTIVITSTDHLFNYQDEEENSDIRLHAWDLLKNIATQTQVFFALHKQSPDLWFAKKFCKHIIAQDMLMGHTARSQRQVIDELTKELTAFAKALRDEDRIILREIVNEPLKHVGSIAYASSVHVWAFFMLAICIEQEKRIRDLEHDLCSVGS